MTTLFPIATISGLLEFFEHGGIFMALLLICSVTSVAVMFLRGFALRRKTVMPPRIEESIEALAPTGGSQAVVNLSRAVRNDVSALGRIIHVALQNLQWPKSENVEAVQTRARHEIVRMESGLVVLEIVVGIAPLLGLLGAVSGLVQVFSAFGNNAAQTDPHIIARGISEALSTTIVGLAVAIPSLIAFSYYSKKVEVMAAEMESLVSELLAKCYYQKKQKQHDGKPQMPPLNLEKLKEEL